MALNDTLKMGYLAGGGLVKAVIYKTTNMAPDPTKTTWKVEVIILPSRGIDNIEDSQQVEGYRITETRKNSSSETISVITSVTDILPSWMADTPGYQEFTSDTGTTLSLAEPYCIKLAVNGLSVPGNGADNIEVLLGLNAAFPAIVSALQAAVDESLDSGVVTVEVNTDTDKIRIISNYGGENAAVAITTPNSDSLKTLLTNIDGATGGANATKGYQALAATADPTSSASDIYALKITVDGVTNTGNAQGDLYVTLPLNATFAQISTALKAAINTDFSGTVVDVDKVSGKVRVTSEATGIESTIAMAVPTVQGSMTTLLTSIEAAIDGADAAKGYQEFTNITDPTTSLSAGYAFQAAVDGVSGTGNTHGDLYATLPLNATFAQIAAAVKTSINTDFAEVVVDAAKVGSKVRVTSETIGSGSSMAISAPAVEGSIKTLLTNIDAASDGTDATQGYQEFTAVADPTASLAALYAFHIAVDGVDDTGNLNGDIYANLPLNATFAQIATAVKASINTDFGGTVVDVVKDGVSGKVRVTSEELGAASTILISASPVEGSLKTLMTNVDAAVDGLAATKGYQEFTSVTDPTTSLEQNYTFKIAVDGVASPDLSVGIEANASFADIVGVVRSTVNAHYGSTVVSVAKNGGSGKIRVTSESFGDISTILITAPGAGDSLLTLLTGVDAASDGADATNGTQTYSATVDPSSSLAQLYAFKVTIDGTPNTGDENGNLTILLPANATFAAIAAAMESAINSDLGASTVTVAKVGSKVTVTSSSTGVSSTVLIGDSSTKNSLLTLLTGVDSASDGADATSGFQTYNSVTDPTSSLAQLYAFKATVDGTPCTGDENGNLVVSLPANATFAQIASAIQTAINTDLGGPEVTVGKVSSKVRVTSASTGVSSVILLADSAAKPSLLTLLTGVDAAIAGTNATQGSQTYSSVTDPTSSSAQIYALKVTIDGTPCTGDENGNLLITLPATATFAQIVDVVQSAIDDDFGSGVAVVAKSGGKIKVTSLATGASSTILLANPKDKLSLITLLTSAEAAVAGIDATSGSQTFASTADPSGSAARTYMFKLTVDGDVCPGDASDYVSVVLPSAATLTQIAAALQLAINEAYGTSKVSVAKSGGKVKITSLITGASSTVLIEDAPKGSLITLLGGVDTAVVGDSILMDLIS